MISLKSCFMRMFVAMLDGIGISIGMIATLYAFLAIVAK